MRRLHPQPGVEVSAGEAYDQPRHRIGDRPWVGVCMVTSLDGTTAVGGRSGGLGNADDAAVLGALRRLADVIVVGAGTVRSEGYGPPRKDGQRIGVVTASGRVDTSTPLFSSGAGFLVMPEDGPTVPGVDVVRAGIGGLDLAVALARLDAVVDDPTYVQAEGGPTLNGALLDAGCVDELDLTISPVLAGGEGRRVTAGAAEGRRAFTLAHLLTDDDGLVFGRWVRADLASG